MTSGVAHSFISARNFHSSSFPGSPLKRSEQCLVNCSPVNFSLRSIHWQKEKVSAHRSSLKVQAGYSEDGGRPGSVSNFVGGFVLGGLIVGTLACVYAPQISKALAADRKDLMRKLPKFIYDEEKALEKTRKILTEKIAQLNSAIDDVSSQLHADDSPNGAAATSDEIEAAV